MSSKRQTTMAKLARERAIKEKRERKQEKREERKRAAEMGAAGEVTTEAADVDAEAAPSGPPE